MERLTYGRGIEDPAYGTILRDDRLPFEDFLAAWSENGLSTTEAPGSFHRWHRIILGMLHRQGGLCGPTLDIAAGGGGIYPALRKFLPDITPYAITDFGPSLPPSRDIAGDTVRQLSFECERDRLPREACSVGTVLFLDVLEHLLIDPVWTLLEINRVLVDGGHLVISTPNAASFHRLLLLGKGSNPGEENHYMPTGIYQRHNREWTLLEVMLCMELLGFESALLETFPDLFPLSYNSLFGVLAGRSIVTVSREMLGPHIVAIFRKVKHKTLDDDLDIDERWPKFLYTGYRGYRQRPVTFPRLWEHE